MNISIELDSKSWEVINSLVDYKSAWFRHMYDNLPVKLAKEAKDHFTPLLSARQEHRGDLERSIRYEVNKHGSGWNIDYYGLDYGRYVDSGNFPQSEVKYASSYTSKKTGKKLRAFPIDKRFGAPIFRPYIHGMGSHTPTAPTHYSEKTVDWLAQGKATELAFEELLAFLSQVIK